MNDFVDKCVVLKVNDYKDDDRLAKVLTAEHGLATVRLVGVKKAKAKLKSFAQEFSVYDARFVCGRGAFLTVVEPMMIKDGFSFCADLRVFTSASVAAEATIIAIGDEQPHPLVFAEYLKLVAALCDSVNPYYQAATFILRLLELSGFYRRYECGGEPKTPAQMLGYAQDNGYGQCEYDDLSRRALKFVCREFERNFDIGLKSVDSIDLYA